MNKDKIEYYLDIIAIIWAIALIISAGIELYEGDLIKSKLDMILAFCFLILLKIENNNV